MRTESNTSTKEESPESQIDAIIKASSGWQGEKISFLRSLIKKADPLVVEEVKWKKPSRPSGVPVWSHNGIICVCDTLKNSIRLTFPKGAQISDPRRIFNSRLDSKTVRAIDFHDGEPVDNDAFEGIILDAVELNRLKERK